MYERSAENAIRGHAKDILFREWMAESLFGGYAYDDTIKVWFIKDENHLRIVNQYLNLVDGYSGQSLRPEHIGLRVAVVVDDDAHYVNVLGTYNDVLRTFTDNLNRLFADPT